MSTGCLFGMVSFIPPPNSVAVVSMVCGVYIFFLLLYTVNQLELCVGNDSEAESWLGGESSVID